MTDFLTGVVMVFYVLLFKPEAVAVDHHVDPLFVVPTYQEGPER